MRSFFQRKLWIVLLASLALVALTVLALGLDNVSFNKAVRFARDEPTQAQPFDPKDFPNTQASVPIWKEVFVWGLIALMVLLIALLLSPESRKKLLKMLIRVAAYVAAIFFLLRRYGPELFALQEAAARLGQQPPPADAQPMPEFQPPQVSPMFSYLISFIIAIALIGIMWGLYRGWQRYIAWNTKKPLEELAHIARSSLNDISSGRDSSDVIINCYLRMSDVVADKRKLRREIAMTPQEFVLRLERAGLPGDAVRRLTRLFEMVRYGDRKSAPKDVSEAVNCLNTILSYCGEIV